MDVLTVTSAGPILALAYLMSKLILMNILKLTPRHPAGLVPLMFDLIFIVPYLFLPILDLKLSALSAMVLIIYGYTLFYAMLPSRPGTNHRQFNCNLKFLRVSVLCSAAVYLYGVISSQSEVGLLLNLAEIGSIARENSLSRYGNTLEVSNLYKIGVILAFAASVQGAFLFKAARSVKDYAISLSVLMVGLVDSIVMGARFGLMQLAVTFLCSLYLVNYRSLQPRFPSYRKMLLVLAINVVTIYVYFLFIQILRGGGNTDNLIGIASHVLTWFFGYLPAFSHWFERGYEPSHYMFGGLTFAGLGDALGLSERVGGMYLPVQIADGRETNVYTAYRGLLEDFGLYGSFVFIAVLGGFLSMCLPRRRHFYWVTFFVALSLLAFLLWSFVISIWTYNSIVLGQAVGVFICFLSSKLSTSKYAKAAA